MCFSLIVTMDKGLAFLKAYGKKLFSSLRAIWQASNLICLNRSEA